MRAQIIPGIGEILDGKVAERDTTCASTTSLVVTPSSWKRTWWVSFSLTQCYGDWRRIDRQRDLPSGRPPWSRAWSSSSAQSLRYLHPPRDAPELPGLEILPVLGDVTDADRVNDVLDRWRLSHFRPAQARPLG